MDKIKTTKINIIDRVIIAGMPLLLGLITGIVLQYILGKSSFFVSVREGLELVGTVIDIWGILLGFVITAVSILLTIGENSFINALVATNHMQSIIFSYVMSSFYLFISIIIALVLLIIKTWNMNIFVVFISINVCIVVAMGLSIYFLFAIVLQMNRKE